MAIAKDQGKQGDWGGAPVLAADGKGFEASELSGLISKAVTDALTKAQANKGDQAKPRESAVMSRGDLIVLTGLSETTLWRLEKAGDFPAKIRLSVRRIGWMRDEIEAWLQSRHAA